MREIVNEQHRLEPWTNPEYTYGARVAMVLQQVQQLRMGVPDGTDVICRMLDEAVFTALEEELVEEGSERKES